MFCMKISLVTATRLAFGSLLCIVAVFAPPAASSSSSPDNTVVSWTIYHSWNPQQEFVRRGSITWSATSEDLSASGGGGVAAGSGDRDQEILKVVNDDASATLNGQTLQDMLDYGWYHVKVVPDSSRDGTDFVMGTVPACTVRRANFKDQFDIVLPRSRVAGRDDPMISLAYTPLVSPLAPKSCDQYPAMEPDQTKTFTSKATVQLDTPAMTIKNILPQSKPPPGIVFSKKAQLQQQGASRKKPAAGDDTVAVDGAEDGDDPPEGPEPMTTPWAFMQRYWYILVPMLMMQFMSASPEQPQQGQQGPAGVVDDGGQQAATTAVASPGASGGNKKSSRRGKRGETRS